MNSFMVWSKGRRAEVALANPGLHNAKISAILGEEWKKMSKEEKIPFEQKADELKTEHKLKYPDYVYQPAKKSKKEVPSVSSSFSSTTDLNATPTLIAGNAWKQEFPWPAAQVAPPAAMIGHMAANFNAFSLVQAQAQVAAAHAYETSFSAAMKNFNFETANTAANGGANPSTSLAGAHNPQPPMPGWNEQANHQPQAQTPSPYSPPIYQPHAGLPDQKLFGIPPGEGLHRFLNASTIPAQSTLQQIASPTENRRPCEYQVDHDDLKPRFPTYNS